MSAYIRIPTWLITGFATFAFLKWGVNAAAVNGLVSLAVRNLNAVLLGLGCLAFIACPILGMKTLETDFSSIVTTAAVSITGLAVVFIPYLIIHG